MSKNPQVEESSPLDIISHHTSIHIIPAHDGEFKSCEKADHQRVTYFIERFAFRICSPGDRTCGEFFEISCNNCEAAMPCTT